jgi:hypothetical protein
MSFPPYPEKFNTFYNTGYKQFWGSGFPYIKDDFVGGYSGLEYPSDDENKVRHLPVMDLQNIASGNGRGTGKQKGRPKKMGKGFLSDLLGTVGSTLGAIGKPIFESVPALKPFEGLLGDNSLYGLASQGLKHIGLGKKKRGGRKMLTKDHPMYVKEEIEPDVRIQPFLTNDEKWRIAKNIPHDIPRPRMGLKSKGGCMDCGDSKKSEKEGGRKRKRKPKKMSEKDEMEKMNGGRRRKKVSKMGGDKKAINVADVMKYKYDNDVSLKDAWKHFKNC